VKASARPETELLLRCASPPGNEKRAERIEALSGQPLDWQFLLRSAAEHSVLPLLYWGVKAVRPEIIPAALEQNFQQNTQNSMHLTSELFQLMALFTREGIAVLPFKGPTLAMAAYRNLALRRFSDLDLLVRQEDAMRARAILLQKGYSNTLQVHPKWEAAYMRAYDEFGLRGPKGSALVELHWAVTPRFFAVPLDIRPFWSRAVSVKVSGRGVPTLCPNDLALVLCLHATKHCWTTLSMVADLAWLMAAWNIEWDEVLERARELGSLRMVLLGVQLGATLLEIPVPEPVVRGVAADPKVGKLVAEVTARMFSEGPVASAETILGAGAFHLRSREGWRDRTRYVVRLAKTAGVEDWQFVELPTRLSFLYPVLRIPRLLRKYWMRIP
jgi:hypothetical protein